MDKKKSPLGTGLSSLLGPDINLAPTAQGQNVFQVNVDHIQPCSFQPRKHFSENELNELSESIRKNGVLQPIIVRQLDEDKYEIIAGERRWRACKKAGVRFIPVIVKEASDKEVLQFAIIENIQRENLTALEEAESYEKLRQDYGYTHEELAQILGKSRSYVSNILRLNALQDSVKEMIRDHNISGGHARSIAALGPEQQEIMMLETIKDSLSVRELERKIKNLKAPKRAAERHTNTFQAYDDADTIAVQTHLSEILDSNVRISIVDGKPTLVIECNSFEVLDLCVEKLSVNSH